MVLFFVKEGNEELKRFREMDWYRRTLVILLLIMMVGFSIVYITTLHRWGFEYIDTILVKSEANGSVTYSGKVHGKETVFTVTGNTVNLTVAGKDAGTYTYAEDPSVILESLKNEEDVKGEVIYKDGKVFFTATRESHYILHTDDEHVILLMGHDSGSAEGNDPAHPTAQTIIMLIEGPTLTHHGAGQFWLIGLFFSVVVIVSILFAQEVFDLGMMLKVRDYSSSEPTELEKMTWYAGWTMAVIAVAFFYVLGLTLPN